MLRIVVRGERAPASYVRLFSAAAPPPPSSEQQQNPAPPLPNTEMAAKLKQALAEAPVKLKREASLTQSLIAASLAKQQQQQQAAASDVAAKAAALAARKPAPSTSFSRIEISPHLVKRSAVVPPKDVSTLMSNTLGNLVQQSKSLPSKTFNVCRSLAVWTLHFAREPRVKLSSAWHTVKHEASHYWTGFKLLGVEIKTSVKLLSARLRGVELTRRQSQQLNRTFTDLLRMGPFLVFVLVPFMEFALPVFLRLFPNMLPSTFIQEDQKQKTRKNISQLRLEMSSFMQEMVVEMGRKKAQAQEGKQAEATVRALVNFVEASRNAEPIDANSLSVLLETFSDDELTIERMTREKLQMMCRFMGVSTIGSNEFLRYSLLARLRTVREDDVQISWEGVESLTLDELKQCALARGMQAESDDKAYYQQKLKRWIELSVDRNVGPAMLILSQAFAVSGPNAKLDRRQESVLSEVVAGLGSDIVESTIISKLDHIAHDKASEELTQLKLESLRRENEIIEQESQQTATSVAAQDQDMSDAAAAARLKALDAGEAAPQAITDGQAPAVSASRAEKPAPH